MHEKGGSSMHLTLPHNASLSLKEKTESAASPPTQSILKTKEQHLTSTSLNSTMAMSKQSKSPTKQESTT